MVEQSKIRNCNFYASLETFTAVQIQVEFSLGCDADITRRHNP
jgi:hypothetical protein